MFRRWLSGIWRDYKEQIIQIAKLLGILVLIASSASVIFSFNIWGTKEEEVVVKEIYKPQEVAISGGTISEEKFEEQNGIIENFVNLCNEQKFAEAYNLLSQKCKEKIYPTLQDFENEYCRKIFGQKREYNIQAWINSKYYSTYRINYTEDFMTTGVYGGTEKYQDYITIVSYKNSDEKKININNYIGTEELNKQTETDIIQAEALYVDTYLEYVNCAIKVKNITENEIVLDNLNNYEGIKLYNANGVKYRLDASDLRKIDLAIRPGQTKFIILQFRKQYGSDTTIKSINFANVITNYSKYLEDEKNYNEYKEINIKLK